MVAPRCRSEQTSHPTALLTGCTLKGLSTRGERGALRSRLQGPPVCSDGVEGLGVVVGV